MNPIRVFQPTPNISPAKTHRGQCTAKGNVVQGLPAEIDPGSELDATGRHHAVEQISAGGDVSPVEVLTAVQKADLAFHLMMQVRNKLVQAFEDVQRTLKAKRQGQDGQFNKAVPNWVLFRSMTRRRGSRPDCCWSCRGRPRIPFPRYESPGADAYLMNGEPIPPSLIPKMEATGR